jgi:hypothetical protein
VGAAISLFSAWLSGTRTWKTDPWLQRRDKVVLLSAQIIGEWLHDRCRYCDGTGLQIRMRNGRTTSPSKANAGRSRGVQCRSCEGTGIAAPDVGHRARMLGIAVAEYKADAWPLLCIRAHNALARISRRINRPLRTQLERD